MTDPHVDSRQVARLLRQRMELGESTLVLEELSRDRALELGREGRRRGADSVAGAPRASPGGPPGRAAGIRAAAGESPVPERPVPTEPPVPTELPGDHAALRELCATCTKCRLSAERTQAVFADGNPEARVMVVGEAPGANEDATGVPFVGAAGKLLDLLLASVGLSRKDSVYICNVIKCRPPANRNPLPDEIESCAPYLRRQIDLVRPEALLAVGTFSGRLLTGRDMPLGRLRGEIHSYHGTPLVVTYHPAALLRNAGWTRATWEDLQLLREVLDGA